MIKMINKVTKGKNQLIVLIKLLDLRISNCCNSLKKKKLNKKCELVCLQLKFQLNSSN